jgi:hypothetical protein
MGSVAYLVLYCNCFLILNFNEWLKKTRGRVSKLITKRLRI